MNAEITASVISHALKQGTSLSPEDREELIEAWRNNIHKILTAHNTVTVVLPQTHSHHVPSVMHLRVHHFGKVGESPYAATSREAMERLLKLGWYETKPAWEVELEGPNDPSKAITPRLLSSTEVAAWFRSRAANVDTNQLGVANWLLPESTMAPAALESVAPIAIGGDLPKIVATTGEGWDSYEWYDLTQVAEGGEIYRVTVGRDPDAGPSLWHFRREAGGWRPLVIVDLQWAQLPTKWRGTAYPLDALIAGAQLA